MGKLRFAIALTAAKLSVIALKITKRNGTNFPGVVAIRICPDFLKYINRPEKIIAVTGTNGKTTVSNLLRDVLAQAGKTVLNNGLGSNIASGIATCLISGVNIFNVEKYKAAVLEVDERSALRIFPYVKPDWMIVTNLSRDSIMRNAHPEYIRKILEDNIPPETKLILNADDLLSAGIAPKNERVYFGIEKMEGDAQESVNLINDMQICPRCHTKLKYEYVRYSSIGKAYCPNCDFRSPEYDYAAYNVDVRSMSMDIRTGDESEHFSLMNEGTFNIYNQVTVITAMHELGYSLSEIKGFMSKVDIVKTRYNVTECGDKTVTMLLSKDKNAYAGSRVFEYIASQPGDKEVILMMNCLGDVKHWSENTCWLYDCDFEFLNGHGIKHIIVTGPREKDYKLRLLMAGVPEDIISACETETDAPGLLRLFENDNIYILYGTDSIALAGKVKAGVIAAIGEEGTK